MEMSKASTVEMAKAFQLRLSRSKLSISRILKFNCDKKNDIVGFDFRKTILFNAIILLNYNTILLYYLYYTLMYLTGRRNSINMLLFKKFPRIEFGWDDSRSSRRHTKDGRFNQGRFPRYRYSEGEKPFFI